MRGFLVFAALTGLGLFFLFQKHNQTTADASKTGPAVSQQVVTKSTTPPELTPAPRGQASEYNWMKRALDRAADVRDKARQQTKESQDP